MHGLKYKSFQNKEFQLLHLQLTFMLYLSICMYSIVKDRTNFEVSLRIFDSLKRV